MGYTLHHYDIYRIDADAAFKIHPKTRIAHGAH